MGKKIDQLDLYGSYDSDKIKADLIEVSKNSGTSTDPIYAPDGSRRMRLDDLAAKLKLIAGYVGQNGLTLTGDNFELGGSLIKNTTLDLASYDLAIKDGNFKIVKTADVDVGISLYNNATVFKGGLIFDKVRAVTSFYGPNLIGYLHMDALRRGGIRGSSPTAVLHISGATGGAGDGPLKIDSATLVSIPEIGLIENDGASLYYTNNSGVRSTVAVITDITASAVGNTTAQWNANKLLGNTIPVDALGYLHNDGAGNLTWASVSGSSSLATLTDVNLTSLANGDLLKYDSGTSKWINFAPSYLTANQTITLSGDISGSGTTAITTTIGAGKVTNAMLAGSIDLTAKVTGLLPDGNIASAATWNAKATDSLVVHLAGTETITGAKTFSADTIFSSTGYTQIAAGTTLQQPGSPGAGMTRYNSTTGRFEFYSTSWKNHVRLDGDTMTGNLTIPAFAISGTAGAGYGEFIAQSSNSSAPSVTGFRWFANSAGSPAWAKKNGTDIFVRSFASTNTADRSYTWQDLSYTVAGTDIPNTFTASQKFGSGLAIQDSNGNNLIAFPSTVLSAVNYLQISNSSTTNDISLSSLGSDTNINILISPKGTGSIKISTDLAFGTTYDTFLCRQSTNTLRISTSSAHSTMGNLEVSKIVLVSGNTSIDGGVANIGLAIAGAGGANTTAIKIAGGSGITGTTTANYHGVMLGQSFSPASGSPSLFGIIAAPTYNIGGGTPVINAFRITPFLQSTTGASSIILFDVGTNSAALNTGTHTSFFNIDNNNNWFIKNTGSAPSSTPSSGGYFYVESGALKFKGSSGTITTIAVA